MTSSEQVSVSHKLFSEIVNEAKGEQKDDKTAYRFSNGRTFEDGAGAYEPEA